jgi:hypothetical protein
MRIRIDTVSGKIGGVKLEVDAMLAYANDILMHVCTHSSNSPG